MEATIQIPEKLLPIIETKARIVVLYGGRGSGKSESVGRVLLMKSKTEQADVLCAREYQNSIDDSVHKLICSLIDDVGVTGVDKTDKKIDFYGGGGFRYKGLARNSSAVRSSQGFKYAWIEEAQYLSKDSIDDLLPTIRAEGSQIFMTANLMASRDPFSQRFIIPFQTELDKKGYYEDGMHLIMKVNWRDNPFFPEELEKQRQWDFENLTRAEYDHIWEGHYNDSVENSIIMPEWFDAAVDAHVKLGFEPKGVKIVSHDPSNEGGDAKGLCYRHGNVILEAMENTKGDVNEGCDWATGFARNVGADIFIWDADGMGASLKRQILDAFDGSKVDVRVFRGGEAPDNPERIYQPDERLERSEARRNKDTFYNKRAQKYGSLRDRFYATYRAVVKKEYPEIDSLISISSKVKDLQTLRSEMCRIPKKANGRGLFQIMTKKEMMQKFNISSPNIADPIMMTEDAWASKKKRRDLMDIFIPKMKRF